MRSGSLPPEHQPRKGRWAAVSFHVFSRPRESLSEDCQLQEKQHAHLLSDLPLAPGLLPPGHDGLFVQALISFSSGCHLFCCLFGSAARHTLLVSCPSGVCLNRSLLGAWAARFLDVTDPPFLRSGGHTLLCLTRLVFTSVCGFITRKVNCLRKRRSYASLRVRPSAGHLCSTVSVCGFITSSALVPSFTFARMVARSSVDLGVRRRKTRAADKMRTNRHTDSANF